MSNRFSHLKKTKASVMKMNPAGTLLWCAIAVGIILRLAQYLYNRSLFLDEARLALNIINRPLEKLFEPLDYTQAAPTGFLMVEKAAVHLFGNSEYALRLFPLLAGIISLFLFHRVAKRCLKEKGLLIAVSLFSLSYYLIRYSSELKQYSSDVAFTLLLFLIALDIQSKGLTASRAVLLSLVGSVALWFSHPALFILAGVGITMIVSGLREKAWASLYFLTFVFSVWFLSFIALYLVSLRSLAGNEVLLTFWSSNFMPLPPRSPSEVLWFYSKFFEIFNDPGGFDYVGGIAALAFLVGGVSLFKEHKEKFFILLTPLFLALLTSGLHKYPFQGRLLLFAVPSLLLTLSAGADDLLFKTRNKRCSSIGWVFLALIFSFPLTFAGYKLIT